MEDLQTTNDLKVLMVGLENIHTFECFLRKGLGTICSLTGESFSFEDLVRNCNHYGSQLFVVYCSTTLEPVGFYVLAMTDSEGQSCLDISAVYSEPLPQGSVVPFVLQKTSEYGILVGAKGIVFSTPRKGAARVALKLGFKNTKHLDKIYYFYMRIPDGS
jgi:hypothetical protein